MSNVTIVSEMIQNVWTIWICQKKGNFRVDKLCTWQECDFDQIQGLIEGDHLKKGVEKLLEKGELKRMSRKDAKFDYNKTLL